MDTKTAKAELVKGLDEAIDDEGAAVRMYSLIHQSFTRWHDTYPEDKGPVPDADYMYMQEQVHRIQQAEAEHQRILQALRHRIAALPDG